VTYFAVPGRVAVGMAAYTSLVSYAHAIAPMESPGGSDRFRNCCSHRIL